MNTESNQTIEAASLSLEEKVMMGSDEVFEKILPEISEMIKNRSNEKLIGNKVLHSRLMHSYYNTYKKINERDSQNEYLLFLLSLLAEIVRQNSQVRLPFSKKTVLSLLNFDESVFMRTRGGHQIMMILLTLFENMAWQGKLMVRLGVEQQLKQGLLTLIGKVDEYSALQISLRALLEFEAKTKVTISSQEL